ncbi:uncharacterized protein LOC142338281 isoform X2 [Convolutriloba macropyga]|uniref:uncharacterized protein LOC142338281 isoform X2 n=1 Tax=Convolutriloba macropyga TaxID=536237 RepID=UPI003F51DE11
MALLHAIKLSKSRQQPSLLSSEISFSGKWFFTRMLLVILLQFLQINHACELEELQNHSENGVGGAILIGVPPSSKTAEQNLRSQNHRKASYGGHEGTGVIRAGDTCAWTIQVPPTKAVYLSADDMFYIPTVHYGTKAGDCSEEALEIYDASVTPPVLHYRACGLVFQSMYRQWSAVLIKYVSRRPLSRHSQSRTRVKLSWRIVDWPVAIVGHDPNSDSSSNYGRMMQYESHRGRSENSNSRHTHQSATAVAVLIISLGTVSILLIVATVLLVASLICGRGGGGVLACPIDRSKLKKSAAPSLLIAPGHYKQLDNVRAAMRQIVGKKTDYTGCDNATIASEYTVSSTSAEIEFHKTRTNFNAQRHPLGTTKGSLYNYDVTLQGLISSKPVSEDINETDEDDEISQGLNHSQIRASSITYKPGLDPRSGNATVASLVQQSHYNTSRKPSLVAHSIVEASGCDDDDGSCGTHVPHRKSCLTSEVSCVKYLRAWSPAPSCTQSSPTPVFDNFESTK